MQDQVPRIYLHFLDYYHYARATVGGRASEEELVVEARRAFRLAALVAERLYLPASSYFEGRLAQLVLGDHIELSRMGVVYLSASQHTLEEHRDGKIPQYSSGSPGPLAGAYAAPPDIEPPPYEQRGGSSRERITSRWLAVVESDRLPTLLSPATQFRRARDLERAWARVPDRLEGRAFVPAYVLELLAREKVAIPERIVSGVIEPAYITGYATSLGAGIVGDLVYLCSPYVTDAEVVLRYDQTLQAFAALGLMPFLDEASAPELLAFKKSSEWALLLPAIARGDPPSPALRVLAEQAATVALGQHQFPRTGFLDCEIGIVTALPEEVSAMRYMLDGKVSTRKQPGDPASYYVGKIPAIRDGARIGEHGVAVTQLRRMGTRGAAVATANLLRTFPNVRLVLMVGIACGVPTPDDPDKHVRLGDIVVSDRRGAIATDAGAIVDGEFQSRDLTPPPSAVFLGGVDALGPGTILFDQRPWEAHIERLAAAVPAFARPSPQSDVLQDAAGNRVRHPRDTSRRQGQPRVFRGHIGAADLLVRDATYRDDLAKRFGLRAIEMESSGVAESTWVHGENYGVIRGACDYGDQTKVDRWHFYAAAAAAGYARAVIENIAPEDLIGAATMGAGGTQLSRTTDDI